MRKCGAWGYLLSHLYEYMFTASHSFYFSKVYSSGSKNMSYDSCSLTTPDVKWLGLRPSDFERYSLPEQCLLPMSDKDIKVHA